MIWPVLRWTRCRHSRLEIQGLISGETNRKIHSLIISGIWFAWYVHNIAFSRLFHFLLFAHHLSSLQKKWQKAYEYVEADHESVYSTIPNRFNRLVIHELCKLVAFSMSSGEISDDEDEDVPEEERSFSYRQAFEEENKGICELIKLIVDISHSLGSSEHASQANLDNHQERNEGDEGPFQVHESVLLLRDSFEKTPLHILCENSAHPKLLRAIFESTRESNFHPCAPSVLSLICAKDSKGSTPLHYLAYSRQCPFSSLKIMLDYCDPSSRPYSADDPTLCADEDGDTPLHWALDGHMSPRRIKQLLRYSPSALKVQNSSGQTPFDQYIRNFEETDWLNHGIRIWQNLQLYLKVLAEKQNSTDEAWLPIHVIARSEVLFPSEFLDMALHFNKEDLSTPDSKGLLPLHLACARRSNTASDESMGLKILSAYPQAAYRKAANNLRLPIHIAAESRSSLALITELLKAYPNALNINDPITGLWPSLLAGANNEECLDSSFRLLRADPSILQFAVISKSG